MKKATSKNTGHICLSCGETYRKQDFDVCPHCAGNGGGLTPKTWKPNKHQKKEFIKKLENQTQIF